MEPLSTNNSTPPFTVFRFDHQRQHYPHQQHDHDHDHQYHHHHHHHHQHHHNQPLQQEQRRPPITQRRDCSLSIPNSLLSPTTPMPRDRWHDKTRNIAPKARIIKNILVLGCSCMCSYGCFAPMRTYFSLTRELQLMSPVVLFALYMSASLSTLYGAIVARKLTYKLTIALCQIPCALCLAAIAYSHYYTLIPAAVLYGLSHGPLWNAVVAYLVNMAAQFSYLSYETQDKMVKRFLSTFNVLVNSGWTWGHLLTAGAFSAVEYAQNSTDQPWSYYSVGDCCCGRRFCNSKDVLYFPAFDSGVNFTYDHITRVVPVYTMSLYAGNVIFAVVLALFLLDKLKVQLCSQTNKQFMPMQLVYEMAQTFHHPKIRKILPMVLFAGLSESFVVCDIMKAYVACTTPKSSVGYVLFAYGLIGTFLSGFLCAAVRHISRITILLAGFACQAGALVVMWMWKPMSDDQPILYVIATSWSIADSIWKILLQTNVYQTFPEQWEAPFACYYFTTAIGLSLGFIISPFGCMEYKIYFMAVTLVVSLVPFLLQELNFSQADWLSLISFNAV